MTRIHLSRSEWEMLKDEGHTVASIKRELKMWESALIDNIIDNLDQEKRDMEYE